MIESTRPKLNRFKYAAMLLGVTAVAAVPLVLSGHCDRRSQHVGHRVLRQMCRGKKVASAGRHF